MPHEEAFGMMVESGVKLYMHTLMTDVVSEGGRNHDRRSVGLRQHSGVIRETPPDIFKRMETQLAVMKSAVIALEGGEAPAGELECALFDVKAWYALVSYYLCKLRAAVELPSYRNSGDAARKDTAVALLTEALLRWKELSYVGSLHYLPYRMARVGKTFGWSFYIKEAERDIALAKAVEFTAP